MAEFKIVTKPELLVNVYSATDLHSMA